MLTIRDYLLFSWQLISGWRIDLEYKLASLRTKDIHPFIGSGSINILDLANGSIRPQYAILNSNGSNVFGIDLVNQPVKSLSDYSYKIARSLYNRQLHNPLNHAAYDSRLICGDVSRLPFADDTFDLVTSVAAFEHFFQVPDVISEVHRITRNGGMVWVYIHPFSSLSGGHNVKMMDIPLKSLPRGIDPWDHLRKRKIPFHVPLNEWRLNQYLEEFSRCFEVLDHYCAMYEGEHLLSHGIRAELSDYTDEELTCRGYILVARKSEI